MCFFQEKPSDVNNKQCYERIFDYRCNLIKIKVKHDLLKIWLFFIEYKQQPNQMYFKSQCTHNKATSPKTRLFFISTL
jgi:hypothetical protein